LQKHPGTAKIAVVGENQPGYLQLGFTFIPLLKVIMAVPENRLVFCCCRSKRVAETRIYVSKLQLQATRYYNLILEKEYSGKY
jgi:type IV secretory pathway protease TraF